MFHLRGGWSLTCYLCISNRAQKEVEVGNGVIGGDTPPEDDPGGGDDDLNVDAMEGDLQDENDDSLENNTAKRVSPHRTPKIDCNALKPSQTVNNTTNSNTSNTINQRLAQVGGEADPPTKKLSETLKRSKSYERGVDNTKLPGSPPVIALQKNTFMEAPPPGSGSQRQQTKRSKERERERGESASSRSRGNRQMVPRMRSQSGGDTYVLPPTPPTSNAGSSMIRVSSSAGVIGVAVGGTTPTNSPRKGRKEDGWKEVGRR